MIEPAVFLLVLHQEVQPFLHRRVAVVQTAFDQGVHAQRGDPDGLRRGPVPIVGLGRFQELNSLLNALFQSFRAGRLDFAGSHRRNSQSQQEGGDQKWSLQLFHLVTP